MMAMVLHIVMVNTLSNDRQYFLTSGKKTFTKSFKQRLDLKSGIIVFQHSLEKSYCFSPCCTREYRENAGKKSREI